MDLASSLVKPPWDESLLVNAVLLDFFTPDFDSSHL